MALVLTAGCGDTDSSWQAAVAETAISSQRNYAVVDTLDGRINTLDGVSGDIAVSAHRGGDAAVAWLRQAYQMPEDEQGYYLRLFDHNGVAKGAEFRVAPYQRRNPPPAVAITANGDSVLVWATREDSVQPVWHIRAQRVNADGRLRGEPVEVATESGLFLLGGGGLGIGVDVAMNDIGDFTVAWTKRLDRTVQLLEWGRLSQEENFVFARSFSDDGTPLTGVRFVRAGLPAYSLSGGTAFPHPPVIVKDAAGHVITWSERLSGRGGIYARRFDPSGQPLEQAMSVSPPLARYASDPDIGMAPDGSFAIAWSGLHFDSNSNNNSRIYSRKYAVDGTPLSPAVMTDASLSSGLAQNDPQLLMNDDGSFLVLWSGGEGPFLQCFDAQGMISCPPRVLPPKAGASLSRPVTAALGGGRHLIVRRHDINSPAERIVIAHVLEAAD